MLIRHNLAAMNAARQYNITDKKKARHTEKLSSGYRINKAADDAAGLAISEKMRRQIRGLDKGIENAQDGISLCQVADGALNEVHDMMQRLEELSVQAANGTNTYEDKRAIQKEITQLLAEIDRVSSTTTFNEQLVFQGSEDGFMVSKPYIPETAPDAPDMPDAPTIPVAPTIPIVSGAETVCGDFIVRGGTLGTDFDFAGDVLTIKSPTAVAIRNANPAVSTTHSIKVEKDIDATVVLEGVNIELTKWGAVNRGAFEIADNSSGNVSVAIVNDNTLIGGTTPSKDHAGLEKNDGSGRLILFGTGSLFAKGGSAHAAGIGGSQNRSTSHITIYSGSITAEGGTTSAAIGGGGGGAGGSGSDIIINGGTVKAVSTGQGAAIGGGYHNSGSRITINGGTVTAIGKNYGAGIGGGVLGGGSDISITGGTVTATGGDNGAGIGGGHNGECYRINITGGTVTATGGENGAGIGGGINKAGYNISITGGIVTATGGTNAQSIGSGANLGSNGTNKIGTDSYAPADKGTTTIAVAGPTGALVIDDQTGTAKGKIPFKQDFAIPDYAAVTVAPDAVITVEKDVQLTNKGTIENNGTIDVYGKFTKIEGGIESDVPEGRGTLPGTGIVIYHSSDSAEGGSEGGNAGSGEIFFTTELTPKGWWIQSGSEPGVGMFLETGEMNTKVLGLHGMDVTTDQGAADGIGAVKGALAYVSDLRSRIGAQQNRLEHTIANERNIVENTTAAESRIRDTDVALEMVGFSAANILAQAGTSVLAQANRDRQGALALLQ